MELTVRIFTDGGTRGNGKADALSGWGTYFTYGDYTKEICGGTVGGTNNQMEIQSVIEGLKMLKTYDLPVEIILDSGYVRDCLNDKWYEKWETNGWKTSKKEPVENKKMWEELITLVRKLKKVEFIKIKGHLNLNSGSQIDKYYKKFVEQNKKFITKEEFIEYVKGNIEADRLANKGMDTI